MSLDDVIKESVREVVREEIAHAETLQKKQEQNYEIMTRSEMMDFLKIGDNKASYLLNPYYVPDFPNFAEHGEHPRIPKWLLILWCEKHAGWVRKNTGYFQQDDDNREQDELWSAI